VVPITHSVGCGMDSNGKGDGRAAPDDRRLRPSRQLPLGIVIIGLGCEVNQIGAVLEARADRAAAQHGHPGQRRHDEDDRARGCDFVKSMLPDANR
jgi:altronate dehydratase